MTPVQESVKLEKLLIDEVSGVDRPANLLDGWLVMKAAGPGYPIGPDQSWDVSAAEKRIRAATGAEDAPNAKYAGCFLYKDADGSNYGDYKFLVCDVVGGDIKVMPQAIRAAASRLSGSSLSDTEKASVQSKVNALESKAGIGDAQKSEEASSILAKVKEMIFPGLNNDEGVDDMTPEEVNAEVEKVLDAKLTPLGEQVAAIAKSLEEAAPAPAEGAASTDGGDEKPELTIEQVTKAIEDGITVALEPYNEILEKVLDRVEAAEKAQGRGVRKSLDGQEGANSSEGGEETHKPNVSDAIAKAFAYPSVGHPAAAALAGKE